MMYYRGTDLKNQKIKKGDYVSSSFELAVCYAICCNNPVVLVLSGSVSEIPIEENAYDGQEFLADSMEIEKVLVPAFSFSSHEEVILDDSHPLLGLAGWKELLCK